MSTAESYDTKNSNLAGNQKIKFSDENGWEKRLMTGHGIQSESVVIAIFD